MVSFFFKGRFGRFRFEVSLVNLNRVFGRFEFVFWKELILTVVRGIDLDSF